MLLCTFLFAFAAITSFAAPTPTGNEGILDRPVEEYQSLWVIALTDAKQFVDGYHADDEKKQVEDAAEQFAVEGAKILNAKGVTTGISGQWDSDYAIVLDGFRELNHGEIFMLNGYVNDLEETIHSAQHIQRRGLDSHTEEYQKNWLSTLTRIQTATHGIMLHLVSPIVNIQARLFVTEGLHDLAAKDVKVATGFWEDEFRAVADSIDRLDSSEIEALNVHIMQINWALMNPGTPDK